MFSVGIIYSSRDFLEYIRESSITSDQFTSAFEKYRYASSELILELCFKCGWLRFKPDGSIVPTERGLSISKLKYTEALLLQLEDMIKIYNPSWASLIPKGREETKHFLPESVKQCFNEAGLLGELSDELVDFWDKLALAYRNVKQERLLELGREGERFSIIFEESRTGRIPKWQSIESNLSGYDLISTLNTDENKPLMIEVKATSTNINYASFYISRNEWETASNTSNYVFHLWSLDKKCRTLYIVSKEKVKPHIAMDQNDGNWQSIEIPFRSVTDRCEKFTFT